MLLWNVLVASFFWVMCSHVWIISFYNPFMCFQTCRPVYAHSLCFDFPSTIKNRNVKWCHMYAAFKMNFLKMMLVVFSICVFFNVFCWPGHTWLCWFKNEIKLFLQKMVMGWLYQRSMWHIGKRRRRRKDWLIGQRIQLGPWMETGGCSSIILSPAGGWGGGSSTPAGAPDGC